MCTADVSNTGGVPVWLCALLVSAIQVVCLSGCVHCWCQQYILRACQVVCTAGVSNTFCVPVRLCALLVSAIFDDTAGVSNIECAVF